MIRLKICGVRENIREVADLGPDYVGFIFYSKSPRHVGEDFVIPKLGDGIKKVGVFVNEKLEKVKELVDRYKLDYTQLHGNESPEYCESLKNEGIGILKAFQVDDEFGFGFLKEYDSASDFFLFDTKTKSYGGSGKTFNWDLLNRYSMEKKYFLSGGVSLENIEELTNVDLSKVHALDVNSRFEIRPGLKDTKLLIELKRKMITIMSSQTNVRDLES